MNRNEKILLALLCTCIVNVILACCRPAPYDITMIVSTDAGTSCFVHDGGTGGYFKKVPCL